MLNVLARDKDKRELTISVTVKALGGYIWEPPKP